MTKDLMLDAYISAQWHFAQPAYKGFFGRIKAYIERDEVERREAIESDECENIVPHIYCSPSVFDSGKDDKRERFVEEHLQEHSFADAMMRLINAKGLNPSTVYTKAGIDRRLFSKIRSHREYRPAKRTVLALCFGMELSLTETKDLLEYCGFCLSNKILADVIVEYFLVNRIFDIHKVNAALVSYGVSPLV